MQRAGGSRGAGPQGQPSGGRNDARAPGSRAAWALPGKALCLGLGLLLWPQLLAPANAQGGRQGPRPPLLRMPDPVSPQQAFALLRRGNQRYLKAAGKPQAAPEPHLAGRYLAAILHSPRLPAPCAELFHSRHQDLYTLSSPGPSLRMAEVQVLEQLNRQHRLSLCLILVRDDDPWLKPRYPLPESLRDAHKRELAACRTLARSAGIPLCAAHGMRQAERLWRASPWLNQQRLQRRFQVAIGRIKPRSGAVDWLTNWHEFSELVGPGHAAERLRTAQARAQAAELRRLREAQRHQQARLALLDQAAGFAAESLVLDCLKELRKEALQAENEARHHQLGELQKALRRRRRAEQPQTRAFLDALHFARIVVERDLGRASQALETAEAAAGLRPAPAPQRQPAAPRPAPAAGRSRGH